MHAVDAQRRIDVAVEIHDLAFVGFAHADVVHVAHEPGFAASSASAACTCAMRSAGASRPGESADLQRLDMGLDLDIGAELVAHRRFEPVGDLVRARSDRLPSTSRSSETESRPPMACTVT